MAVDEGVMIKTGSEVRVSVRNAITGQELGKLREAVEKEFLSVGEQEAAVKVVLARMESDLFQRMARLRHGR